jgi:hypothetical protein
MTFPHVDLGKKWKIILEASKSSRFLLTDLQRERPVPTRILEILASGPRIESGHRLEGSLAIALEKLVILNRNIEVVIRRLSLN